MPKFEKLANFTKLQKMGFWGTCIFQLCDLGRVVGTDMNYPKVKLAKKTIGSGQKALKPTLELISRFFSFKNCTRHDEYYPT